MSDADEETKDPLDNWNAILIAVVTVIAALVAWRASVASDGAGDADYDGLKAVVNRQEVSTLASVDAFQHAQAYGNYRRYAETSASLDQELEEATGQEAEELQLKQAEADILVDAKLSMFPNKYMDREGRYRVDSDVGEQVSDEARTRDMEADSHFAEADVLRVKTERLLMGVVFLSFSLVALTLVEVYEGGAKKAMFGLGLVLALGGAAYAVMVEVARL
ncbi:MAG: hypothetical protein AB1758_18295 [Candidatus Eremiobacterota bacterium]